MPEPISIIIPAFNQLEYCRQCIASITANTRRAYRLILVDNGSTDGVSEFFDAVPGAEAVHSAENLGFAAGVNLGLARATGHALLLNSDTLLPAGWLGRLEQALLQAPDIGMVGPRSNCVSGGQQIDGLEFASMTEVEAFSQDLAQRCQGRVRDTDRLVAFCVLIRDEVRQRAGGLDERYGLGNFEDDDYCLRVRQAGYRLCVAEDAFVFHYGSRTFLGMGLTDEKWRSLMAANEQRYTEKWGLRPEHRTDAALESRQLNERAHAALAQGDMASALGFLKDAIAAFPLLERNYNDLGAILWEIGERERAYAAFAQAVRLRPGYGDARANLRHAAEALGKSGEAEALLGREDTECGGA